MGRRSADDRRVLALIAINIALVGWRADVVRWFPQTASLYAAIGLPVNLRGLVFANVTTEKESQDGVQVLVVEGKIVNAARHAVDVPRLRFAVRNDSGHEIYTWTALPDQELCWRPARRCRSARGWPRRRARATRCWCASSTGATLSPEFSEERRWPAF